LYDLCYILIGIKRFSNLTSPIPRPLNLKIWSGDIIAIKVISINVWALFWENAIYSKEQKPKMVVE